MKAQGKPNRYRGSSLSAAVLITTLALTPQAANIGELFSSTGNNVDDSKRDFDFTHPLNTIDTIDPGLMTNSVGESKSATVVGDSVDNVTLTDASSKEKKENLEGKNGIVKDPKIKKSEEGKLAFDTTEVKSSEFIAAGVVWNKNSEEVTQVSVQLREKGKWTEWNHLNLYTGDESESEVTGTDPLLTNGADAVKVQVFTKSGKAPADLKISLIDPGVSQTDNKIADEVQESQPVIATNASYIKTNANNNVETTATLASLTPATADRIKPAIVTRAQWGANESLASTSRQNSKLSAMYLHHTAGTNNYTKAQSVQQIRSIYMYHTVTLKWGDIGYHFLVDKYGTIYEGRRGAINSLPIGTHAGGFNTNTIGISAMGNYDVAQPSSAMISSIEKVAAWKSAKHGLNLNSTTTLTGQGGTKYPYGTRVTVPTLAPHKATSLTACPGRYLEARMPSIRVNAEKLKGVSSAPKPVTKPSTGSTASKTYTVKSGDGWGIIAQRTGVSMSTIQKLNGMNAKSMLHPGMVLKLTSSGSTSTAPKNNTSKPATPAPAKSNSSVKTYTVKPGDGWWLISYRTGVSMSNIQKFNGLNANSVIHPGMVLKLANAASSSSSSKSRSSAPAKKNKTTKSPTTSNASTYTVKSGDGWGIIAQRTGVSMSTIQKLNGMNAKSMLHPGMVLKISSGSSSSTSSAKKPSTKKASTPSKKKTYTVKSGDSWWLIAARNGVPMSTLLKINGKTISSTIHPGMVLKLN